MGREGLSGKKVISEMVTNAGVAKKDKRLALMAIAP